MSGSVDSTVYDYFSLLLREPEVCEVDEKVTAEQTYAAASEPEPVGSKNNPLRTEPLNKLLADDIAQLMTTTTLEKPAVDRALLERLLAPVIEQEQRSSKIDVSTDDVTPARLNRVTEAQKVDTAVFESQPVQRLADVIKEADALEAEALQIAKQQELSVEQVSSEPVTQNGAVPPDVRTPLAEKLDDEFQVLFFSIAGLTLAVPLVSLGGIIRLEKLNHIIGRPEWYLGLQTHRGEQVNVVDTCAWVMPEHIDKNDVESKNYQYVVQLSKSNWGLACESLLNATRIDKSQVNWRTKPGKRPWLAGVVKEQMCGILNVDALITMLDAGLGCQDPIG
ncbi:chemotaxis protein CheW [Shewanella sp. GXUN23E]|uniref:chemotaxis protein CheW n=1 Tax=Shewanella sp. GXUN23E TaxID=3422498 RepID=UPI003D7ECBCE